MRSKKAVRNIIANLALQLAIVVFGFIFPRVVISKYGSETNGLISSITNFLSYISLVEAGFGGIVQFMLYKPIAEKDSNRINDILAASQRFFGRVAIIFIFYVIALCFLYPTVINTDFGWLFTASLIVIISISTFMEYYYGWVYKVYLCAEQKKYIVSLFSILTYVLNIIAVLIVSNFDVSIQFLELVSAVLFIIRPILQNLYVRKKYKLDIKNGNRNYPIKQKWDALAQHIAAVIHANTDVVVLTIFRNLSEVSVYAIYGLVIGGIKRIIAMFYDSISSGFGDLIARKEDKKLNDTFNVAESLFFTFIAIIFSCTLFLITPFVEVYTNGITDIDYIRPVFGYLIVTATILHSIRLPYSSVALAAGHYRQTRNGAIVECLVNLIVSIVLVVNYGLIGVAIGTMVAMLIRTCEFVFHSNKYVLNRSIKISIKKILVLVVEIATTVCISNIMPMLSNTSYLNWFINALLVLLLSCAICVPVNIILYHNDFVRMRTVIGSVLKRNGRTK